jgi:hypothetical protein
LKYLVGQFEVQRLFCDECPSNPEKWDTGTNVIGLHKWEDISGSAHEIRLGKLSKKENISTYIMEGTARKKYENNAIAIANRKWLIKTYKQTRQHIK